MKKIRLRALAVIVLAGINSAPLLVAGELAADQFNHHVRNPLHYSRPDSFGSFGSNPTGNTPQNTPSGHPSSPSSNFFSDVFAGDSSHSESFGGGSGGGFTTHSMPEPSAIPELAAAVAALGFVALRRRKKVTN